MNKLSITENHDDFNKTVWNFWFYEGHIYLDKMWVMSRNTKRHKYIIDYNQSYSRLNDGQSKIKEEPDIPIDMALEALDEIRQSITVKVWK